MNRFLCLFLLIILIGCSSEKKQPKFQAAESTDTAKKKDESAVPAWMKGKSATQNDASGGNPKSVSTIDAGKVAEKSTPANNNQASTNPSNPDSKSATKPGTSDGTKSTSPDPAIDNSAGETTALMAKLLEGYNTSQQFFKEQQQKQLSQEEILKVREEYANQVEKWLAIADELLKRKLRPRDRVQVVSLKQLAHQTLFAFNRPEHEQKLYEFGETLKDDTNNEIRKIYEFIKLQKPFTQILRGNPIDEEAFFKRLEKVISYWRDDFMVYQNVESWLSQLYGVRRDYFVRALEIAAKHFPQSTNTQIMSRSDILKDRLEVARIGFDVAITNVANGEKDGPAQLMDAAKRLLAKPNQSSYILMQIVQAGIQLEVRGEYDLAKKYYDMIAESLKDYTNQKLKESILFFVNAGITRYNLLGKPLKVEGMVPKIEAGEFVRKPIDFSSYRGKVVILFFWAFDNRPTYILLEQLDQFYLANQDKALALIGVNADRDMNTISQVMSFELRNKKRKWTHLMPSTPKVLGLHTTMARRCGVDSMPFNVIIDKNGNVDSYRVYGKRLEDTIERLLGEPIKRTFPKPPEADKPSQKEKGNAQQKKTENSDGSKPAADKDADPAPAKDSASPAGSAPKTSRQPNKENDKAGADSPNKPKETQAGKKSEPAKTPEKTNESNPQKNNKNGKPQTSK